MFAIFFPTADKPLTFRRISPTSEEGTFALVVTIGGDDVTLHGQSVESIRRLGQDILAGVDNIAVPATA